MKAVRITVGGIVQGVGFRPWVWNEAKRAAIDGWIRNTSSGVEIFAEGSSDNVDTFVGVLGGGPPLARVESLSIELCEPEGHAGFEIVGTRAEPGAFVPVAPDVAACDACLAEMRDSGNRRYRYPLINCTNCGPRFTIVRDIPYDRPHTTMAPFVMCARCRVEYENPSDRRYHAQPIACPDCGPTLRLVRGGACVASDDDALDAARGMLRAGRILAVKGLGGYHLACDARNEDAVARLRAGKRREGKPFALMAPDAETVARHAGVSKGARALLTSPERPIVLLPARGGVASGVAPGQDRLGFMLAYTPLHHLLLEDGPDQPRVLVMTSANLRDEPIAYLDDEAQHRLGTIANGFLLHDRAIHMRTDDSVVAERRGAPYFFRRSRGYAPLPIDLPVRDPSVLATGGEMKNVFCLTRDGRAFLSHHIGELGHLESYRSFEEGVAHFESLFRIKPTVVAYDTHPDYLASRYALERAERNGLRAIGVQHHHAHVASCMADNGLDGSEPVIGVAFDGTGYGPDGAIWGGEFLIADYTRFDRALRLRYAPLPGGDAATRRPYRTAMSWLREAGVEWEPDLPPVAACGAEERAVLGSQLEAGINAPATSSIGRLFDAFASIAGVCQRVTYEAQAAAELEAAARSADAGSGAYRFGIDADTFDPRPAIASAVRDVREGAPAGAIARRFHRGLSRLVVEACARIRESSAISTVALSGGVWQNMLLLEDCSAALERDGFTVLVHRRVPANDGGLCLGQAAVAAAKTQGGI